MNIKGLKGGGGKGGGGGGGAQYREDPNTIASNTVASLLEVISCGQIRGLVNGLKSVYFDKTPVENPDGSFNFSGLQVRMTLGTPNQPVLPGFETLRSEFQVNTEITYKQSVTRRLIGEGATSCVIRIQCPGLSEQLTDPNNPALVGAEFHLQVFIAPKGSGFYFVRDITIKGKSTSAFEKSYYIALPDVGEWDLRIVRKTADSEKSTLNNKSVWAGYTLVSGTKLNYPNTALMSYVIDAKQFGYNLPTRYVDMYGLYVQVPSNYNPDTRTYTGIWNGTFKLAWSDNPAWFLWWLLTDTDNGMGQYIPQTVAQLTKMDLYNIAKYCDELVPNGFGGMEPRFTFNAWIVDRQKAIEYLRLIAGSFRIAVFLGYGGIGFSQDAPKPIRRTFAPANVINGVFTYAEIPLAARHTVATVTYHNPDRFYEADIIQRENPELIRKFGVNPLEITLLGCTSRGQAARAGDYALISEELEYSTVVFSVSIKDCDMRPGDLIAIADPNYAGVQFGGLLVKVDDNIAYLDREINFNLSIEYSIYLTLPDNTVEIVRITPLAASTDKVLLATKLKMVPNVGTVWAIKSKELNPRVFRIISIQETNELEFNICAVLYDSRKYDMVEKGLVLDPPIYSTLPTGAINPPIDVTSYEYFKLYGGRNSAVLNIAWTIKDDPRVIGYEVGYQTPIDVTYNQSVSVSGISYEILDTIPGVYRIRIRSISSLGLHSAWTEYNVKVLALKAPLPNVTGFTTVWENNRIYLIWNPVKDTRTFEYLIKKGNWNNGSVYKYTLDTKTAIEGDGVYSIKAVNEYSQSELAATLEVENSSKLTKNVVATFNELADGWDGLKEEIRVIDNELTLVGDASIYDVEDIYALLDMYTLDDTLSTGIYTLTADKIVPLSVATKCNIIASYELYAENIDANVYSVVNIFSESNVYGDIATDSYGAKLQINVKEGGQWRGWENFYPSDYVGEGFAFRVIIYTNYQNIRPYMRNLIITVDVPDKLLYYSNIEIPETGVLLEFVPPFNAPPTIVGTIVDATGGENLYLEESLITKENVFLRVVDKNNNTIRKFTNILAQGY